jgi:metal-dependent HD superfamily phosphatase/phosphodiesterase
MQLTKTHGLFHNQIGHHDSANRRTTMRALRLLLTILAITFATVAAADIDGSAPLTCTVIQNIECHRSNAACEGTTAATSTALTVGIDFTKKEIRSPYRKALLAVQHTATNTDSLVLQGGDLFLAWSALVDKKTGALTISIADKEGAYVYFGTCKATGKK